MIAHALATVERYGVKVCALTFIALAFAIYCIDRACIDPVRRWDP